MLHINVDFCGRVSGGQARLWPVGGVGRFEKEGSIESARFCNSGPNPQANLFIAEYYTLAYQQKTLTKSLLSTSLTWRG